MLSSDLKQNLPPSSELPCSDDTPVDNEDQNFVPNYLLFLLEYLWKNRQDWYFGVDMAVYHTTGANPRVPVVPDAFLSLGAPRQRDGQSRDSYVVWEEDDIVPVLAIEMVSKTPGGEYGTKQEIYRKLGVLYYVAYNPKLWQRDRHLPFEVYKLVDGAYQLQVGEPFWMPELGLGIGRCPLPNDPLGREVMGWYDAQGDRLLSEAEVEAQQAARQRQRVQQLEQRLRELGEEI